MLLILGSLTQVNAQAFRPSLSLQANRLRQPAFSGTRMFLPGVEFSLTGGKKNLEKRIHFGTGRVSAENEWSPLTGSASSWVATSFLYFGAGLQQVFLPNKKVRPLICTSLLGVNFQPRNSKGKAMPVLSNNTWAFRAGAGVRMVMLQTICIQLTWEYALLGSRVFTGTRHPARSGIHQIGLTWTGRQKSD